MSFSQYLLFCPDHFSVFGAPVTMNLKSFRLYTIYLALAISLAASRASVRSRRRPRSLPPPPPAADAPKPLDHGNPEFLHAADEVLAQMSTMLQLPIKEPLKKTLRSK